jgi:60 kDa SS-A/Ro ribonucleoprotein
MGYRLFLSHAHSLAQDTKEILMDQPYTGFGHRSTPQSEPIPGKDMVPNSAGGYSFAVDDMARLTRFLILGSSTPTYYASARKLTRENLEAVERLLLAGRGMEVVSAIIEISEAGRAPNNDPALFALARCCAAQDKAVSRAAYDALPRVARIGTHLFHFMEYVKQFRGVADSIVVRFGHGIRARPLRSLRIRP